MMYEIRRADMQNYKEYTIWKHATEDVWEICDDDFFKGSDTLIMVETKKVREFDLDGKHFRVFAKPNGKDQFSKEEDFKSLGKQKVVYYRFSDSDFVDANIIESGKQ